MSKPVIVIFPNKYDDGRPCGMYWDSRDEMIEDPEHVKEMWNFDVNKLDYGPIVEGIQVLHAHGFNPFIDDYIEAIRYGFESLRQHEWAVMLDSSWHFDAFTRGEYEDETGHYDRWRDDHKKRWQRIFAAMREYIDSLDAIKQQLRERLK